MIGSFTLLSTEKEELENFNLETSTDFLPEFSRDNLEFAELPTLTVPKFTVAGEAVKLDWPPDPGLELSWTVMPPHPVRPAIEKMAERKRRRNHAAGLAACERRLALVGVVNGIESQPGRCDAWAICP